MPTALAFHSACPVLSSSPPVPQIKYADGHIKVYGQWLGPADEAAAALAADGVVGPGAAVNATNLELNEMSWIDSVLFFAVSASGHVRQAGSSGVRRGEGAATARRRTALPWCRPTPGLLAPLLAPHTLCRAIRCWTRPRSWPTRPWWRPTTGEASRG